MGMMLKTPNGIFLEREDCGNAAGMPTVRENEAEYKSDIDG